MKKCKRSHLPEEERLCGRKDSPQPSRDVGGIQSFHLLQHLARFSERADYIRVAFPFPGGRREGGDSLHHEIRLVYEERCLLVLPVENTS